MTSAPEAPTAREPAAIAAVCLDIDDTLLDNASASRAALAALVGNDAAWPVWRRITDQHYERCLDGEVDFDTMCVERTRAFFAAFGEEITRAEAAERERRRMDAMQHHWELFDDARPCLDWLRGAGMRVAVITNAPSTYQRTKIASVGLADAFDAVLISGERGASKPDGALFREACAELGNRPAEVVHVGDRLDADALGAARAGMHGVWLNRHERTPRHPAEVTAITTLHELPEFLTCDLGVAPDPAPVPAASRSAGQPQEEGVGEQAPAGMV